MAIDLLETISISRDTAVMTTSRGTGRMLTEPLLDAGGMASMRTNGTPVKQLCNRSTAKGAEPYSPSAFHAP